MRPKKPTRTWIVALALAVAALMMVGGAAAKMNTARYESWIPRLDGSATIIWAMYEPYIVGGILLLLAGLLTFAMAVQVFRERTWTTLWQMLVILDALSVIAALFLIIPGTPTE